MRASLAGLVLAASVPAVARAGDVGGPSAPMVDVGVEQRSFRAADGSWQWGVDGGAVLPVLDLASVFRFSLRFTDAGQVDHLSARWGIWQSELNHAEALSFGGRLDRGANERVSVTFAGGLRLEALAGPLGLARTPWVELGMQASSVGADAAGRTRWSSSLVLALDFDLASAEAIRHGKASSGIRIRASAALGNDPGCGLGTPTVLFSGRCLTLALAVEY
jgi:hypothetical protein